MTCGWITSVRYFSLVVLAVAVSGCAQSAANKRHYVLEANRPEASAAGSSNMILEVRRFTVDAAFAGRGLVYRLTDFEYDSDFYHEFLVAPAVMISEKTRQWLARSGLFGDVFMLGSRLSPTHTLEGNITALYGDLRDEAAPRAVLELRCFLINDVDPDETVMMSTVYQASNPLESRTPDGLVEALDLGLAQVLGRLEEDLRARFSGSSG